MHGAWTDPLPWWLWLLAIAWSCAVVGCQCLGSDHRWRRELLVAGLFYGGALIFMVLRPHWSALSSGPWSPADIAGALLSLCALATLGLWLIDPRRTFVWGAACLAYLATVALLGGAPEASLLLTGLLASLVWKWCRAASIDDAVVSLIRPRDQWLVVLAVSLWTVLWGGLLLQLAPTVKSAEGTLPQLSDVSTGRLFGEMVLVVVILAISDRITRERETTIKPTVVPTTPVATHESTVGDSAP